jgi:hypothetical protein
MEWIADNVEPRLWLFRYEKSVANLGLGRVSEDEAAAVAIVFLLTDQLQAFVTLVRRVWGGTSALRVVAVVAVVLVLETLVLSRQHHITCAGISMSSCLPPFEGFVATDSS